MTGVDVTVPADPCNAATADGASTSDGVGETLSFAELNRRIVDAPMRASELTARSGNRRSLMGFAVTLVAYGISLVAARLPVSGTGQLIIQGTLLAIELTGVVVAVWSSLAEFKGMSSPIADFADELDHDYAYHFEIQDWLTQQPRHLLERHAAMARFRRERFTQKLPLLAGNVPTLGIVTVFVAIYLQAREVLAGRHLTLVDGLFGAIIAFAYVLTWTSALSKSRLESMEMHLQAALETVRKNEEHQVVAAEKVSKEIISP